VKTTKASPSGTVGEANPTSDDFAAAPTSDDESAKEDAVGSDDDIAEVAADESDADATEDEEKDAADAASVSEAGTSSAARKRAPAKSRAPAKVVAADDSDDDAEEEIAGDEDVDDVAASSPTDSSRGLDQSSTRGDEPDCEIIIVVPRGKRRTSHMMSLSEYTEAISLRAEQISADGVSGTMLDSIPHGATTAREIAIAEIRARRCPLKIRRFVGSALCADGTIKNYAEIWSPNEMTHPAFQ
jgi:hypothetical protein